jgi:hypothetical protein
MHRGEWKMAIDIAQPITESRPELRDDGPYLSAVRALIIAILDQRDRCICRPLDVIPIPDRQDQLG